MKLDLTTDELILLTDALAAYRLKTARVPTSMFHHVHALWRRVQTALCQSLSGCLEWADRPEPGPRMEAAVEGLLREIQAGQE